jgi:hypothetical protein
MSTEDRLILERILSRCEPLPQTGCLIWTGWVNPKGYGETYYKRRYHHVHRLVWILTNGPIAPGLLACHACDVRPCANIDHIWLGTPAENSLDMVLKGRCHEWTRKECPKGHPYNEQNTFYLKAKSGRLARNCKECARIRGRERYRLRRLAQQSGVSL